MGGHTLATRRAILRLGVAVCATLPVAGMVCGSAAATGLPALDPAEPTANAMGYVQRSARSGETCANCTQYSGRKGVGSGSCELFPGKRVAAAGWCSAYVKKPGA